MATASVQSANAYGYGQWQRLVAQRNAEQLETKARVLSAQANSARKDADNAIRQADQLEIESGSARSAANYAWQAVLTSKSAIETGNRIGKQADKIYQALQSDNSKGLYDRNGQSSSSSYAAGSLFKIAT